MFKKNNTDNFFCRSCSNSSALHVRVKKIMFCSNYVGDHEYISKKNHKIFASLGTIAVE